MAEMPFLPLAPAVVAAVHDATGVWFDRFPLTPERVAARDQGGRRRMTPGVPLVLIRGGGDLATGVAARLQRGRFRRGGHRAATAARPAANGGAGGGGLPRRNRRGRPDGPTRGLAGTRLRGNACKA